MKYKHIVFDWDGTLADTFPVISAAYDYTFDKMKLPRIPYDEVKRITSTLQNKDVVGHIFGDRKQEAFDTFYSYIAEYHTDKLVAMDNAKELLDYCKSKGYEIYLITNKHTRFVLKEIEKLGFRNYFKKIVAAGEYLEDKPSPIATHQVFEKELPPSDTILVIGDGEADVKTAHTYNHNNKFASSIIYDPNGTYKDATADYQIKNLIDAISILEKE